ncbi:MAG: T9SS type A sorting domain-containing protein [Bacteroidetes bacterium]|nr:T9SS type A sorting domain-containing protein [Bacteroidota bacterium]
MKPKNSIIISAKWLQAILCISMVLLLQTTLPAQMLTNSNVLISNSAQITVKGDVQNNAGTVISNTGIIDLTGNWTNNSGNSIFGLSNGTVVMNGVNQIIQGTDQTVFNNLTLQNGIKTLEQSTTTGGAYVSPSGILNCGNAMLDLNSNTLTVNNQNGTAVTSTTGYILSEDVSNNSKVTWRIATTTGIHTIPFGNVGGTLIPYTFNLVSGNAGDVTVSTYSTAANNTPYPSLPVNVTHVRDAAGTDNSANTVDRFWQVDRTVDGAFANYTFTYAPSENAANGNINTRAQKWNISNLGWDAALPAQINPTAQSVLVSNVNTSGTWAVALQANPLPVELISFSAQPVNNKTVLCKWSTASELNNSYFTVERSRNGKDFEAVGIVQGNGTTNIPYHYTFEDVKPFTGLSYYRLKQTDFNGDYSYSQIENVLITSKDLQYVVYPNPNDGNFQIKFNAVENNESELILTDAAGRIVLKQKLTDVSGLQSVSLLNAATGFYFLQIVKGDNKFIAKVQILR